MIIESSPSIPATLPRPVESSAAPHNPALTLMTCDVCDLVGGPFPAAEAAHLRAVHDRLHHGILAAA
jgi:hypothetical protein